MECWLIKVTNRDKVHRKLNLFTYLEYVGNWNAIDDQINLQYTQLILKMSFIDNMIDHGTNVNIPAMPDNFEEKDQGRHTFFAVTSGDITGYDTEREVFLGPYRTYANPLVVEEGKCKNSLAKWFCRLGWAYYSATQYILGIQPGYESLKIDPCIPSGWREFKISRRIKGKALNIHIRNPHGIQKGVKKIFINGEKLNDNCIPYIRMKDTNKIEITMG